MNKTTLDKIIQFLQDEHFQFKQQMIDTEKQIFNYYEPQEKIWITIQMPCGCAVGSHPPGGHQHPSSFCPMENQNDFQT